MAFRANHPYLVPMTLPDLLAMCETNDPICSTTLTCPNCCNGAMDLDLEPVPTPDGITGPLGLTPVLVCTTCGCATPASHAIYGPRDTTPRRG